MITFVVNLHPRLKDITLAEPFLYPLQKENKIELLFPHSTNLNQRIEEAVMSIRRRLEQLAYTNWQVVFLTAISKGEKSPYQQSLSAQMLLIRRLFLEKNKLRPSTIFMLSTDHVNEDDTIPSIRDKVYRESWELDTKGYITDSDSFFVNLEAAKTLDQHWRTRVKIRSGIVASEGFEFLPLELKEKVNEAIDAIEKQFDRLLAIEKMDFKQYQVAPDINYVDAELIAAIKQTFYRKLAQIKQNPLAYNDFFPSEALKASLSQHLGVFSIENYPFRLIRIPFVADDHEYLWQRYSIKLSIFLSLIAEDDRLIRGLAKDKNYTVNIKLNDRAIERAMQTYWEYLYNMETTFSNRLNNPIPVQVPTIVDGNCNFTEKLENVDYQVVTFGFLRKSGDLIRWKDWNENIDKQLDEHRHIARRKMQNCITKSYRDKHNIVNQEVPKIDHKVEDLKRSVQSRKAKIQHGFLSNTKAESWKDFQDSQAQTVKSKLFSRPHWREIAYLVIFAAFVLLLPFLKGELSKELLYPVMYYVSFGIAMISLALIVLYFAKKTYMNNLLKITKKAEYKARNLRENVDSEFERQKTYLNALCELSVERKNYEAALAAKKVKNDRNLLLDYHYRKLGEHRSIAQKILTIFKANTKAVNSRFNEQQLPEITIEQPIHQNAIYSPNTFIPDQQQGQAPESSIGKIEGISQKVSTTLARLASNITFKRDNIYSKSSVYK